MTVADLIVKLHELDPNLTVMMAADEEGNNYDSLGDVEVSKWVGPMGYGGNPVHPDDVAEDHGVDDLTDLPQAVVLWP